MTSTVHTEGGGRDSKNVKKIYVISMETSGGQKINGVMERLLARL